MNDEANATPTPAARQFHDVVFMVEKVIPGEFVRGDQEITARVSAKFMHGEVDDLMKILQEYKDRYQEGTGPIVVTFLGRFR
jgi:hypothetical protein